MKKKTSIQNIIFDVSDVLTMHVRGEEWSNKLLSEECGIPFEIVRAFFEEYKAVGGQKHGMSLEEFWAKKTVDTKSLTLEAVKKAAKRHHSNIAINTEMLKVLKKLMPNYRLFALTNVWNPGHHFKEQLDPYFEAFVQSCDINLRKPDPAVFQYMLNTHVLEAEETLFVDNKKENVKGAQSIGIHAIHFTGIDALCRELKKYDIEI